MTKEECFYLGRITKPFGLKGEVVFYLDVDEPEQYAELDAVLVETKGSLVPYFIRRLSLNGNKAIVSFDELSREEALSLVGRELYLPLTLLPKLEGNRFYFHEVVGFDVVDSRHGHIGTLRSVLEYPAQPLFQIDHNGTEILVPIIDPVIQKVERSERRLYITAPDGLIDLYLNA